MDIKKSLKFLKHSKGKIFTHYKGGEYLLLDVAKQSDTEEPLVVYKALYDDCEVWVRPVKEFCEETPNECKEQKYKFELCTVSSSRRDKLIELVKSNFADEFNNSLTRVLLSKYKVNPSDVRTSVMSYPFSTTKSDDKYWLLFINTNKSANYSHTCKYYLLDDNSESQLFTLDAWEVSSEIPMEELK